MAWLARVRRIRTLVGVLTVAGVALALSPLAAAPGDTDPGSVATQVVAAARTLDGRDNNPQAPARGQAGTPYLRLAPAAYPDGRGAIVGGPPARYVSNRIFTDNGQNLFSERDLSQWVWIWGQFIDHDVGLRDETKGEPAPIRFDARDPLERFRSDRDISFARSPAAPGTGTAGQPRQQVNQISSFIDGSTVYGLSDTRLDWLREGPVDGDATNNRARLLLPEGFLPRPRDRGDATAAPLMDLFGPQTGRPGTARVAGDVRANENTALTLLHTLFAREHNRVVAALPASLTEQQKFEIARKVVGATIQYITYAGFLPAVGVPLPRYQGYDPSVNPSLSNEFASVGYRSHSMVHGIFNPSFRPGEYSAQQLAAFRRQGIGVTSVSGVNTLDVPLTAMLGNPGLLGQVGIAKLAADFAAGHQYRNDEQIDDTLRSVLFQVPRPGLANPPRCTDPLVLAGCFTLVQDLGAIDIQRGRDHGMPSYNELRRAFGLAPRTSFTAITGEDTDQFADDPRVDRADPIDDPQILDFIALRDIDGAAIGRTDRTAILEQAVSGTRRSTLAARLRAVYGSVDEVDAFVGMIAEPHLRGSDLGELQSVIWRDQFQRLRDGDRFFFGNDPTLAAIESAYGISYKRTLAQVIESNSVARVQDDVFITPQG